MKHFLIPVLIAFLICGMAFSAENAATSLKTNPGSLLDVPIMLDKAENLAGVKLVVNYDKELLTFKEANTTKNTRSLMSVVNDKTPGRLIVVMAGAQGISGKDIPLVVLTFEVKKDLRGGRSTRLEISETQLMSDRLKEIKGNVAVKGIDILPAGKEGQND